MSLNERLSTMSNEQVRALAFDLSIENEAIAARIMTWRAGWHREMLGRVYAEEALVRANMRLQAMGQPAEALRNVTDEALQASMVRTSP